MKQAIWVRLGILIATVALSFYVWCHPLPPLSAEDLAEKAEEAHHATGQEELPIQAYYHRTFFGEPWREAPRSRAIMWRETLVVLDVLLGLELALHVRRRRRQ